MLWPLKLVSVNIQGGLSVKEDGKGLLVESRDLLDRRYHRVKAHSKTGYILERNSAIDKGKLLVRES